MSLGIVIITAAVGNNNLCHSNIGGQQSIECVVSFALTEGRLKGILLGLMQ